MKKCCPQCHQPYQQKSYRDFVAFVIIAIVVLLVLTVGGWFGMKWYVDKEHDHAIKWSDTKDKITMDNVRYDRDTQMTEADGLYNERIDELEASIAKLQASLSDAQALIFGLQEKQGQTDDKIAEVEEYVGTVLGDIFMEIRYEVGRINRLYKALQEHGAKIVWDKLFWKRYHDKNLKDLGKNE